MLFSSLQLYQSLSQSVKKDYSAGLTHLEHESCQQNFCRGLDVQFIKTPLLWFEASFPSHFNQSHVSLFGILYGKIYVLLLHLLYESQNANLCHVFSQAKKNHSLFPWTKPSPFNILCLHYFLHNSSILPQRGIIWTREIKGTVIKTYY